MRRRTFLIASTALTAMTLSPAVASAAPADLAAPWTGPFGGVPPFDRVRVGDFGPALESAMAQELAEVAAIAGAKGPATFENPFAALERSGRARDRVETIYAV